MPEPESHALAYHSAELWFERLILGPFSVSGYILALVYAYQGHWFVAAILALYGFLVGVIGASLEKNRGKTHREFREGPSDEMPLHESSMTELARGSLLARTVLRFAGLTATLIGSIAYAGGYSLPAILGIAALSVVTAVVVSYVVIGAVLWRHGPRESAEEK